MAMLSVRGRWAAVAAAAAALVAQAAATWVDPCESASGSSTGEPDHSVFTRMLQAHVRQGTINDVTSSLVVYETLRADPSDLRLYLSQLCSVDLAALSAAQRLATLINAYNAVMLGIVVHYAPNQSVLELSSIVPEGLIWKHKFATLGGEKVSLDDIEHGMIRGGLSAEFGAQGRIHAAVNCASLSCPDLLSEAFEASRLEEQLDDAAREWLGNPTKNPGLDADGGLTLSQIFAWYGGDFIDASGSVQAWVRQYTEWEVSDSASLSFIPYDWNLNAVNATGDWTSAAAPVRAGSLGGVLLPASAVLLAALAAMSPPAGRL